LGGNCGGEAGPFASTPLVERGEIGVEDFLLRELCLLVVWRVGWKDKLFQMN